MPTRHLFYNNGYQYNFPMVDFYSYKMLKLLIYIKNQSKDNELFKKMPHL